MAYLRAYITCTDRNDGPGAQAQAIMSTIAFARRRGLRYFHTPFSSVAWWPGRGGIDYAKEVEASFNLGEDELGIEDCDARRVVTILPRRVGRLRIWFPGTLYKVQHCHAAMDRRPDDYATLLPVFRHRYNRGYRKFEYREPNDRLSVAVHIRRGDVGTNPALHIRHTSNENVFATVQSVVAALIASRAPYQLHIISEGDQSSFGRLAELEAKWHLECTPIEAIDRLIRADILVMSKSSFSYAAALLSAGIVIYEPFWHSPLTNWIALLPDGSFSEASTQRLAAAVGLHHPGFA